MLIYGPFCDQTPYWLYLESYTYKNAKVGSHYSFLFLHQIYLGYDTIYPYFYRIGR